LNFIRYAGGVKYLGVDYGTKRIGLATSDEGGSLAFPLATITAGREALTQVAALIKKEGVQKIVIGESKNFKGEANPVMEDIEQFKKDLEELTQLPVVYEQEFFTSALAVRQFAPEAKSRKDAPSQDKLDAAAAALILQSYLDRIGKKE
jgi:putative Holliday junction resolvase